MDRTADQTVDQTVDRTGVSPQNPFASLRAGLDAYLAGSNTLLSSIAKDGYADFLDTFIFSNRRRLHDAADAVLRLVVAHASVVRDVERGVLDLSDTSFKAVQAVALERLRSDSLDLDEAARALSTDPSWQKRPVLLPTADGGVPLSFEGTERFFLRSVHSYLAPTSAAQILNADEVWRALAAGAATGDPRQARLAVAHALYFGQGAMPPIANQALLTMVDVAEVNPFSSVERWTLPKNKLEALVADGAIDGFYELENASLVYTLKDPEHITAEVRQKLGRGALDDLPRVAKRQLADLASTELEHRLDAEASASEWRAFGGAAIELALISAASLGTGALAEGAAIGAHLSIRAASGARFAAQSAAFTTIFGLKTGDLSAGAFVRDAAMFKALSTAHRFGTLTRALFGEGRLAFLARPAALGASLGTAASVLTAYDGLVALAEGDPVTGQDMLDRFVRHVAMVAVLHAVNHALMRVAPQLRPGAPAQAEYANLRAQLDAAVERVKSDLTSIDEALALGAPGVEAALVRLETSSATFERLATTTLGFVRRTTPELVPKVTADFAQIRTQLEELAYTENNSYAQDPMRTVVAKGLHERAFFFGHEVRPGEAPVFGSHFERTHGMVSPRPAAIKPAEAANKVLGHPRDPIAASEKLPILLPQNVRNYGRYRLLSSYGSSPARVYVAFATLGGHERPVAIKEWNAYEDVHRAEASHARLLGELGIGPRVHGILHMGEKRGLVMDLVIGETAGVKNLPGPRAVLDLRSAMETMGEAGIALRQLRYMLTREARAIIIGSGDVVSTNPELIRELTAKMETQIATYETLFRMQR